MLIQQPPAPDANSVLDGLPTLRTRDPGEAQERVSELFCRHELRPLSARGSVKLNLRSTGEGFGVHLLDYGAAVRIEPDALQTFFMVQVPLSGRARLCSPNSTVDSTPALASVPPIDQDFSMVWEAGTPQLIITVPREVLGNAATALFGATLDAPLQLANSMKVATPAGKLFIRSVFEYHDLLNIPENAPTPYVRRLHEEVVLARWLLAMESNFTTALGQGHTAPEGPHPSALVADFQDLLLAHSGEDLSVGDLAEALGVSVRTLQAALAKELSSTPSHMLREARVRRAHQMLTAGNPRIDNVTDIAQRCGFGHLGRFAQAYRQQFGFSPSQSLRGPGPAKF
ncbi:AraC family transcriptional regulator [Arthrobacter livingstonensis]|uniref:AraC family transcriptional regulator n=1 Tax=Arthrobacter livingstonensis TaxID=670078 RepID=A0A2V5L1K4_9MICC|nr:AraC family transcriptional regulator [Arthrobacter livingstonensis]PYI65025.1 AraC family transcriptional regulator [Arthrobacter livingstonensis]